MDERNLSLIAAGVAFYAMLALFPALAAVIAIWGFFSDPQVLFEQLKFLERFVPSEAYSLIETQVINLTQANDSTLGWASVFSTLVALWTARSGVAALIRGLNTVHGTPTRHGLRSAMTAIVLTLTLVTIAIFAMGMIIILPLLFALLPDNDLWSQSYEILRWALIISLVTFGLGVLYRYGPNTGPKRLKWITPGAVAAVIIWGVVSAGFSIYLSNFGNYNEIYGSIGAVIAMLMWFYISAWVILLGGSLNAALILQREKS